MSRPNNKSSTKLQHFSYLKDLKAGDLIEAYFSYIYTDPSCNNQYTVWNEEAIKAIFLGIQSIPSEYTRVNRYYFYALENVGFNLFISKQSYVQGLKRIAEGANDVKS